MAYDKKNILKKSKGNFFAQTWWVFLFVFISGIVYIQASYKKSELITTLDSQLTVLNQEKDTLLNEREDLLLQVNSQSDPAWIQLILMKGLGLVPEGQTKVYFFSDEND